METIIALSVILFLLAIIRAQMLQKTEDKERYPGIKIKPNKRGNLYTRFLRAVLPKKIK